MRHKIAHIITRLDAGGSSTNTIETVARLNTDRYAVDLIYGETYDPDGKIAETLRSRKINARCIESLCRNIHPVRDIHAFWTLYRHIKQQRYDLVHTHSSKAGIIGRWAAKLAGTRVIIHTPHGHIFYGYFPQVITTLFQWLEQITARFTQKIITLTERGRQEHIKLKIALPEKFIPIYSGIDLNLYQIPANASRTSRAEWGFKDDQLIFGTICRLTAIKGTLYLIKAFAVVRQTIPDARLILAGDGDQRKEAENLIKDLRLTDSVHILGWREDVPAILHSIDIFVLASLNEGMGRSVLEAMACGKPVIATRVGGIPELVQDQQTGLLVPPADTEALAEAMIQLGGDKDHLTQYGAKARQRAGYKFSIEKMVQDIDQLYGKQLRINV